MLRKLIIPFTCLVFSFVFNCNVSYAILQDPGQVLRVGGDLYTKAQIPFAIAKQPQADGGRGFVNVSNNKSFDLSRLKRGEASSINVLSLVEMGDGGIFNAAKNGGIKKIHYVDVIKERIWAYYYWHTKITTVVYGE